jgi:glycosyltransferase involved in cell wall biosynthesis
MPNDISVVLCTHNPRLDYLNRALDALRTQTLPTEKWELLVIDNCSDTPLSTRVDIGWQPRARIVEESRLGLTPARLRGIAEARSDLLVFVDDDNVLAQDYLQQASTIAAKWPMLGSWGAACFRPEFEVPPPDWTKPYWPLLVIWSAERDHWSNHGDAVPCGAGMCVRRFVADTYFTNVSRNGLRMALGRRGADLTSAEDADLALTSCDLQLGTGFFTSLRVTHLIPQGRLTLDYLLRLAEAGEYSRVLLGSLRDRGSARPTWKRRLVEYVRACMSPGIKRRFRFARIRGQAKAWKTIRKLPTSILPD